MPMLLVGFHAPAFSPTSVDSLALEVLAELVFAERAPLYRRLVLDEQKVEHLDGGLRAPRRSQPLHHPGAGQAGQGRALRRGAPSYQEIARVAAEGTDDRTLAEVVSRTRYAFARHLYTADHVALVGAEFLALTGTLSSIDKPSPR